MSQFFPKSSKYVHAQESLFNDLLQYVWLKTWQITKNKLLLGHNNFYHSNNYQNFNFIPVSMKKIFTKS